MKKPNIIIVDDEIDICEFVKRILEQGGIVADYDMAESGEAALKLCEVKKYDLAVLDKHMPGMDGFEVLARIKDGYPDTEVIMLTSIAEPYMATLIELKGAHYVPKPPHKKAFVLIVKKILSSKGFAV